MNFLQIAQAVRRGVGYQGTGPTSVVNAQGPEALMVDAVLDAWNDIQTHTVPGDGTSWKWMRASRSFSAAPDTEAFSLDYIFDAAYDDVPDGTSPASAVPDYRLKNWFKKSLYMVRATDSGGGAYTVDPSLKSNLSYRDYDSYVYSKRNATTSSQPNIWTIRPQDNALMFGLLDTYYQVYIDYQKSPQVMTANTDVPELPSWFHQLIVHGAVARCASDFGNRSVGARAESDYASMFGSLMREQVPKKRVIVRGIA